MVVILLSVTCWNCFLLIVNIRPYTELSHLILSVPLVVRDILRLFLRFYGDPRVITVRKLEAFQYF